MPCIAGPPDEKVNQAKPCVILAFSQASIVISLKPGGAIEPIAKPLEDIVRGTTESSRSIRARKTIMPCVDGVK
jgi:hypothetical protein